MGGAASTTRPSTTPVVAASHPQRQQKATLHFPEDIATESPDLPRVTAQQPLPSQSQPSVLRWQRGGLIGRGGYGRVYLALNVDNGQMFAVKHMSLEGVDGVSLEELREVEAEVNVMRSLDHENIVRYLGAERTTDSFNIFLEYVPGGSIANLIQKFGRMGEPVIRTYTKQIVAGLAYLHEHSIVHRDVKGANILVDHKGTVKLADFGASKKLEGIATASGVQSIKGTPFWMAPEVIRQAGHGWQADIWSLGCTIIEMATGKPPYYQFKSHVVALYHIASATEPPPFPESLSAEGKDFLSHCLVRDPQQRWSARKLAQHPFIAQLQPSPTLFPQSHSPFRPMTTSFLSTEEHASSRQPSTDATFVARPTPTREPLRVDLPQSPVRSNFPPPRPEQPRAASQQAPRRPEPGIYAQIRTSNHARSSSFSQPSSPYSPMGDYYLPRSQYHEPLDMRQPGGTEDAEDWPSDSMVDDVNTHMRYLQTKVATDTVRLAPTARRPSAPATLTTQDTFQHNSHSQPTSGRTTPTRQRRSLTAASADAAPSGGSDDRPLPNKAILEELNAQHIHDATVSSIRARKEQQWEKELKEYRARAAWS